YNTVQTDRIQIPDMSRSSKAGVPVSVNPVASFPVR
ncbi:phycobilisome rod-core linker polypeptide CpcG2, partial [filamentous cyanobacterium CCP1]